MKRNRIQRFIYVYGAVVLAVSLPLSHFLMGFGAFILLLNWIAQWDWHEKWERMKENRSLLWFSGLYVVCLLGLFRTQNWHFAGSRLLSDLPLLLTPVIIGSSEPFTKNEFRKILYGFIAATLVGVAGSLIYWLTHTVTDIRQISIFIDHIRFSLCVDFALLFTLHILRHDYASMSWWWRAIMISVAVVLLAYLFVAQTLSGMMALLLVAVVFVFVQLFRRRKSSKRWVLLGTAALILGVGVYVGVITYDYFHDQDAMIEDWYSAKGNPYEFDKFTVVENGHRVGYYVCRSELQDAWSLRSDTVYTPYMEQTLIRYLNSKGMHKDYNSVMLLSEKDVRNVEQKIANVEYTGFIGLKRALYPTYFSVSLYDCNGYIDNSSLMQRLELWNASLHLIRNNWLLGVGLGDYKTELDNQLARQHSTIAYKHNRGSHNQWLTYLLVGGIFVVVYFMCVLIIPPVQNRKDVTFLYVACLLVLVASMIVEDTLSSQTGRMLFAMFLPLILQNERHSH